MTIGISFLIGLLAVSLSAFWIYQIKRTVVTTEKGIYLSGLINQGARFFLSRQFQVVFLIVIPITLIIGIWGEHRSAALLFLNGSLISILTAWGSVYIANKTNLRTAELAQNNLLGSLKMALYGGQAISLMSVGLGLLGLVASHQFFSEPILLIYYVFGLSLVAFFLRIGGGIYTKSADMGADLVGKIEKGIPEDARSNPLSLVDQIGDNVGDLAGAATDLQESYISALIIAMILGWLTLGSMGLAFPLCLGALSLLASLISSFLIHWPKVINKNSEKELKKIGRILNQNRIWSGGIFLIGALILSLHYFNNFYYFLIILTGLIAGRLIGFFSARLTRVEGRTVERVVLASQHGGAAVVLSGLKAGLSSVFWPSLIIVGTIFLAYRLGGFYGIALAAIGALGTLVIELAANCFGPIVDNAGGLVRMAGLTDSANQRAEKLDAIGNSLSAVGKSFAIVTAAFTVMAWISVYLRFTFNETILFLNSSVLIGLIMGATLVFLFSSLVLQSANKGAALMADEARRLIEDSVKEPKESYDQISRSLTSYSLKQSMKQGLIVLSLPLLAGWLMGPQIMGGLLAGSLITAFPLALLMSHSGTIWDNAKKRLESSDQINSAAHQAVMVGDLIGDPLKDIMAPALNILIKLIGVITLVFVSLFV